MKIQKICLILSIFFLPFISSAFTLDQPPSNYSLGFDVRMSLENNFSSLEKDYDYDHTLYGNNINYQPNRFVVDFLKINLQGKINYNLSYRLRFRFDRNDQDTIDGQTEFLDYAYIEQKLNHQLRLRLGRQWVNAGATEGIYTGGEIYLASLYHGGGLMPFYKTGANLIYNFAKQEIMLMALNGGAPNQELEKNQRGFTNAFIYNGNFFNGIFKPILSYHYINNTKQTDPETNQLTLKETNDKHFAVGFFLNFANLEIEMNHVQAILESRDAISKDPEENNINLMKLSYLQNNSKFIFQYEHSEKINPLFNFKFFANPIIEKHDFKREAYTFIYKYYPNKEKKYYYYFSYWLYHDRANHPEELATDEYTYTRSQWSIGYRAIFQRL